MSVDPLDMAKLTKGERWCHRTQPMFVPRELQRIDLVRLACIREQCPLWDPQLKLCLDVVNSNTLIRIARTLSRLEDRLPPELP